jgi:hypothetical protein
MSNMRYAIVYRKLVRDLKKHYEIKDKEKRSDLSNFDCEELYNKYRSKTSELFGTQIQKLGFNVNDVSIAMGSICMPKLLKRHFQGHQIVLDRIKEVNDYLYKFSFE